MVTDLNSAFMGFLEWLRILAEMVSALQFWAWSLSVSRAFLAAASSQGPSHLNHERLAGHLLSSFR